MAKRKTDTDLLRLIRSAGKDDPTTEGTITTPELAALVGCPYEAALRTVHDLVVAGKLRSEKVPRRNIHGELQRVKGFRVA